MWRTVFVALLVALAYDQVVNYGRYTDAVETVVRQIMMHMGFG